MTFLRIIASDLIHVTFLNKDVVASKLGELPSTRGLHGLGRLGLGLFRVRSTASGIRVMMRRLGSH